MLERPPDVTDDEVLAVVWGHWEPAADGVEHLPVGWGAHHWRVDVAAEPVGNRRAALQRQFRAQRSGVEKHQSLRAR